MTADVLIVYASKKGSTEQVARRIGEVLRSQGLTTATEPARDIRDLNGFGAVLVGGSIYMGRWHHDARGFLRRFRRQLERVPFAVFALGPGKNTPKDYEMSRHQLDRALGHFPEIEARTTAIFGGVIDPEKLRFPFSHMDAVDLRDWGAIRDWAKRLPTELDLAVVANQRELAPA